MPIRRASPQLKLLLLALVAVVLLGAAPAIAAAATFEVNTTVDSETLPPTCGEAGNEACVTLRGAIIAANATLEADTIDFGGLPAGSTIEVEEAELPAIEGPLTIDGATAAGTTAGEPGIELEATGEFTAGLKIVGASDTTIEGFAIGGFYDGILVEGTEGAEPSGDQICGNYLGTELDGETAAADNIGVQVGSGASDTTIGNGSTCAGNSIVANFDDGIVDSGEGTTIAGNEIGLGPTGLSLPNGSGSPESAAILETEEAAGTMIGGVEPSGGEVNLIWFNEGAGVLVEGSGGGVSIRHDSFLENTGKGIEVVGGDQTPPTVEAAFAPAPGELSVEGTTTAAGSETGETVTLEFYGSREACGEGVEAEGQTYLGSGELTGVTGPEGYSFTLPTSVQADQPTVVATATREDGATTEFSICAAYEEAQTLTVNTRGDTAEGGCATVCSLREAIEVANLTRVKDTIDFAGSAEGVIEVEPEPLPPIENPIEIDGTTAPGYAGSPLIQIDGTKASAEGAEGLSLEPAAGGSIFKGLAIGGFETGVYLNGTDGSRLCSSWIGVGLDGATALPNDYGVEVGFDSPGNGIGAGCGAEGGDVISGNREWGIRDSGVGTVIAADRVGVDVAGEPLPNGTNRDGGGGIQESEATSGTVIGGGPGGGAGNVVADNIGPGIAVQSAASRVKIRANSIFGNERPGIELGDGGPEVPTVESVALGAGTLAFTGEATAGDGPETIELDFFASPACGPGEGRTYLGSAAVSSGGGATAYSTGPIAATIPAGQDFITATSTGSELGQTSEFSGCFGYEPPPAVAIVTAPPASTEASTATFAFAAAGGSVYECSLDGAAFGPCTSPVSFGGLAAGPHTFAVRSVTAAGNVGSPTRYEWTVAGPPPSSIAQDLTTGNPPPAGPTPTNGESVVVAPVKGKVLIKLPGTKKYVPLQELKEIPVGAVIDATKGRVKLTSRNPDGTEQTAEFFEGVFRVKQRTGSGLVVLELLDTRTCPAPGATGRAIAGSLALRPATSGTAGKLWGSGHGNFRTEGNDGSATVRGTIWLVEDRCDGTTFFKTRRDVVTVRDFTTNKTFSLREGRTYIAGP